MKHYLICSLCHNGILGGGLIAYEQGIKYMMDAIQMI